MVNMLLLLLFIFWIENICILCWELCLRICNGTIIQLLYGFRILDDLIQTRGNVERVKKSARNHEPKASDFSRFS